MKQTTLLLSPAQMRAKNCYQLAIVPAMFLAMSVVIIASTSISILLSQMNIMRGSSGSTIFIPCMFMGFLWAHLRAVRKVKIAGLSLASQSVEVVTRVETDLKFEVASWFYPRTLLSSLGNALFLLLLSAGGWWLWHVEPISGFQKMVGFVGFWMSLWASGVAILFIRAPLVHFDNRFITAFPSPLVRRRVRWRDIASCEIRHVINYMGQGPTRFFVFKSARAKTLLWLNSPSLYGLTSEEQAAIEREIKRRLGQEFQDQAA